MEIHDNLLEACSLELLSDVQTELRDALNALGGSQAEGLLENYRFYTAAHINRAVEGYIHLRKSQRIEASKHLIRTAIEALIHLQAVQKKPELLFRIAYTEFSEDKKWVSCTAGGDISAALRAIENQWIDFKQAYHAKYPDHPLLEKKLSLRHAAECAGIERYYDSHYRLYCRFTHAAFRATTGSLNEFDRENNRSMALCALSAVEALSSIGAPAPNIESFRQRLTHIDETEY